MAGRAGEVARFEADGERGGGHGEIPDGAPIGKRIPVPPSAYTKGVGADGIGHSGARVDLKAHKIGMVNERLLKGPVILGPTFNTEART